MNQQNPIITTVWPVVLLLVSFLIVGCDGDDDEEDDSSPEAFVLSDRAGVGLDEYIESNAFEVAGINTAAAISITGGEYRIGSAEFTTEAGEVNASDVVRVRLLSSEDLSTSTEATLTIGGVSDTFTVTTVEAALNARDGFKSVVFSWPTVNGVSEYRVLEKFGTSSEFVQIGRTLGGGDNGITVELPVHKQDWQNSEYQLEACTPANCSTTDAISVFDYMQRAIGYFKAPNTEENDLFSVLAISADGQTIAVGAPGEDSGIASDVGDNSLSGAGAVYIYVKDNDSWRFQSYIKSPTPGEGDAFGSSVALNGDGTVLAVGVPNEDSAAVAIGGDETDNTAQDAGAVYLFERFGDTWTDPLFIKPSTGAAGAAFGSQVALSDLGSTLVVSAPSASNGTVNAGAVAVFAAEGDTWVEKQIIASTAATQEGFGTSLAVSTNGQTFAVGARFYDASADGSNITGRVYIFNYQAAVDPNPAQWVLGTELSASNARHEMEFGYDLDLAGNGETLVVGAPGENSGAFEINGDQNDTSLTAAGAAYVFALNGGNWAQTTYLKANNSGEADRFGSSVAINLDGSDIAVGAPGEKSAAIAIHGNNLDNTATDAGAVYMFSKSGDSWAAGNYVKAPNTDSGDAFGSTLDIDASGDALLVGAAGEDSDDTLLSGSLSNNTASESGAVYLY